MQSPDAGQRRVQLQLIAIAASDETRKSARRVAWGAGGEADDGAEHGKDSDETANGSAGNASIGLAQRRPEQHAGGEQEVLDPQRTQGAGHAGFCASSWAMRRFGATDR